MGFAGLIAASVGLLEQLRDALNSSGTSAPAHQSWGEWTRRYLINVGLVVATGFLLLVSLVVTSAVSALTDRASCDRRSGGRLVERGLVAGLLMTIAVFTLVYV